MDATDSPVKTVTSEGQECDGRRPRAVQRSRCIVLKQAQNRCANAP